MKSFFQSKPTPLPSIHQFDDLFGVRIPPPALQRGWLHSRELILPWDVERIADRIGAGMWLSNYCRFKADGDTHPLKVRPYALGGFWPTGGFVELLLHRANPLDDHPRGVLCVHAATPAAAETLMTELVTHYCHDPVEAGGVPRVGLLNYSGDTLTVERIPVTAQQIVPRDRVDLYYRDGTSAWIKRWCDLLNTRRYGLTVLTGHPGTGKTTLLRSLAHWLASTHMFYFMPAARFASVESGELVTFWADENRHSRFRKVLILEDAESVLLRRSDDNREKVATLLNLTDGMLGDALGLHVVCTLNSDLADLDPALLRPGRLIAHRDFELLTAAEARRLAELMGVPVPGRERVSLAELFHPSELSDRAPRPMTRRALGFHVPAESIKP